jgi:HK97 family phage major capsid protein
MLSRTKRELRAVEDKIVEKANEAKSIIETATNEGRSRTEDENARVSELHSEIEHLKSEKRQLEDQRDLELEIQASVKDVEPTDGVELKNGLQSVTTPKPEMTPGEVFVSSEGFKAVHEQFKAGQQSRFSTGAVNVNTKGTLLEGTAGSGAGLIPVPQVLPGQVEKLFQPLTIADLILSGQAQTNSLRYVVEGTATSGAAGVAEGGAKPESTLGLSTRDEPVKKIATTLVVSDEMLEDVSQVRAYIDGRLSLFVKVEEERELVRGAGTNELVGILDSSRGINIYAGGTAAGTKAEQLFKAMNGQRGSAFLEPDFLVLHPTDWQELRLAKDTANQYYGGGPFLGPYGGPQGPVGQSGQISGAQDSIWGKPVIVTTATGAGTALVGTRSAAQLFRKGGLTVEASNSHSDYFTKNLVAIRAEQRQALAVYRPTAFTEVRLA